MKETDIDALVSAIPLAIQTKFPQLKAVEIFREDREPPTQTPVCWVEIPEFDPSEDFGTGQQEITARFEALFIHKFTAPRAKLLTFKLATQFCAFLKGQPHWPRVNTGEAVLISAQQDHFDPALDEFVCWRVTWTHILTLGNELWPDDEDQRHDDQGNPIPQPVAQHLFVGVTPNIGPGHLDDYSEVIE